MPPLSSFLLGIRGHSVDTLNLAIKKASLGISKIGVLKGF